ncbi:dTMP kinase [Actinotalea sp. M2MS4P-6]|uniref:dTMP kinase n=1 Tax=Actinotalea sp. M2MS4P-6 TaxID=2983762 RepID=UPI0021E46A02|nr:dTMP kinase [Actinotalea sp. M2MS4P-6]MCV2394927.1 dTMP kinase [Actinotalea sp. M2MS4P-6]
MSLPSTLSGPSATGVFCSFEGGDGVGKTTQIRLLGEWLESRGVEVVVTREPGGTELGLELRAAVMHGGHVSARTEAMLYATDRAHHVDAVVRPALERGAVVVTDRYLDSSVAYQGAGRELGVEAVEALSLWATEGLLPHLTVLLDLDPSVGLARLADRTEAPDRLERAGEALHARARAEFLRRAAADPGRWLVVDASAPVDEIAAQVRARIAPLVGVAG